MKGKKMKLLVILFCILTLIVMTRPAHASSKFAGEVKEAAVKENIIECKLSNCLLNIYVLESNIIRFRYTNKNSFSPVPSYAVIWDGNKEAKFSFNETDTGYELNTEELKVIITKNPCRISVYDKDGNLINEDEPSFGVSFDGNEVRCYKKLFPEENFYGLGEKTGELNRKGTQYTMWNSDVPFYSKVQDPLYVTLPFFMGIREKKAYGIFFDNTYKSTFCMGAGNDRFYWFGADGGEMDYYFIYGPEMKKIITSYTEITGRMKLPPLWALGYQQCRWSYYPESEVRSVADNFRNRNIPCDVIYLDIDYMDGYRVFTWDKERFPEPEKMLSDLKKQGFKIIPIIDPGVKADNNYHMAKEGLEKDLFAKYPDGTLYRGEVWPSWAYFPDFTKEETKVWWAGKLSGMLDQGIKGFWNDMNEPAVWGKFVPDIVEFYNYGYGADHKKIHNVYALEMAKATNIATENSSERHFVLTRAAYAGIQRYSAVWTGDNVADGDHLLLACLMPQSMGISGIPFIGSDVGGFGGYPSQNLYARWMQLGAFTPFFRGHSCTGFQAKEPWNMGDEIERITGEAIKLRYRFLPYLYNEFYNAAQTGLPIMRPMFLNYQDDAECYTNDATRQFMIGENLLVAPVVNENDVFKKLYLPKGRWMSFDEGKIYEGNRWIIVDAPLSKIPLFIKEGAVIPLQDWQNYVGEKEITEYEYRVFPGEFSSYSLYEDDGISYKYREGAYSITEITVEKEWPEALIISYKKPYDKYESRIKSLKFKIYDMGEPENVSLSGDNLKKYNSEKELEKGEGFFFDSESNVLYIKVKDRQEFEIKTK